MLCVPTETKQPAHVAALLSFKLAMQEHSSGTAQAQLCPQVHFRHKVESIKFPQQPGSHLQVFVRALSDADNGDNGAESAFYNCSLLLACDGARSVVRKALAAAQPGRGWDMQKFPSASGGLAYKVRHEQGRASVAQQSLLSSMQLYSWLQCGDFCVVQSAQRLALGRVLCATHRVQQQPSWFLCSHHCAPRSCLALRSCVVLQVLPMPPNVTLTEKVGPLVNHKSAVYPGKPVDGNSPLRLGMLNIKGVFVL